MLCAATRRRRIRIVDVGVHPRGTPVPQPGARPGPQLAGRSLAERAATASAHPAHPRRGHGVLVRGQPDAARPGTVSLRGYLSGTAHGIAPEDFPSTTGTVHRIRLLTQHYTRVDERGWLPVPGTITMSEVQRSPRWFTDHPRQPPTDGTPWVVETGVLLDLAVRRDLADPER